MRKCIAIAGIMLVAALTCAGPSKADTVSFILTGGALPGGASFSLPSTVAVTGNGSGTDFATGPVSGILLGGAFTYSHIELGLGPAHWAFGGSGIPSFGNIPGFDNTGDYFGIFAPNLFTINGDGTITLNEDAVASLESLINNMDSPIQVNSAVTPDSPVGTPEPASLMLLGMGGAALVGLRRRKTA